MSDEEWTIGKRVCIKGYGTAGTLHTHSYTVHHVTATMVILEDAGGVRRRYRKNLRGEGRNYLLGVSRESYGGTTMALHCQKEGQS